MKVLIHSNAPWCGTGYGVQTALFAPRFQELGHEVAVSAFHGLVGAATKWQGIPVFPAHHDPYGADMIAGHAEHFGADLVLTLIDVWALQPGPFKALNVASWMPVDCDPMSARDVAWLQATGAAPIAMAHHGERLLTDAGFHALYVPHGVDTSVYRPLGRDEMRKHLGLSSAPFVVGINSANKGNSPSRKCFPQQFEAFARLVKKHEDAMLLLHTDMQSPGGLDLPLLLESAGVREANVFWSDQYSYRAGMLNHEYMAAWYNACDVVSQATYGEGFGLPTLEAQACGVPVVVTNNSASAEMVGSGWKVPGHRYWNPHHQAWWSSPDVDALSRVYEKAYQGEAAKRRGAKAVEFAVQYDADLVAREYWGPVLKQLEAAA